MPLIGPKAVPRTDPGRQAAPTPKTAGGTDLAMSTAGVLVIVALAVLYQTVLTDESVEGATSDAGGIVAAHVLLAGKDLDRPGGGPHL